MFGVRISSSTSCSNWPPEIPAATLAAPTHACRLKFATLPLQPYSKMSSRGKGESYLIQDEPGGGGCFSYKMSLGKRFGMLGIDSQHAEQTRVEPGGDPRVSE